MDDQCAAAKNDVNASSNGAVSALQLSLTELVLELRQSNQLLIELISQNAVLIDSLLDHEESESDEARFDMAGNPIRVS